VRATWIAGLRDRPGGHRSYHSSLSGWCGSSLIIVIAFITVRDLPLFVARRHGQFVAKLHGLGYLLKTDAESIGGDPDPNSPEPHGEHEPH